MLVICSFSPIESCVTVFASSPNLFIRSSSVGLLSSVVVVVSVLSGVEVTVSTFFFGLLSFFVSVYDFLLRFLLLPYFSSFDSLFWVSGRCLMEIPVNP